MTRHPFDPTALVAGIVFTIIAGGRLLGGFDSLAVQLEFVLPLALIGLGVGILLGDRRRPETTEDDVVNPTAPLEPRDPYRTP